MIYLFMSRMSLDGRGGIMQRLGENMEVLPRMFDMKKLEDRGSVVISKTIRDQLGWKKGDRLAVSIKGNKVVIELWDVFLSDLRP